MNGILNIYKEAGFTSFDVVAKLRGILHIRKIGHTGTLDPMACGVLPVCVGNATKLCEMLTDHDKVYETQMILGTTYDTQDVSGNKLSDRTEDAMKLSEDSVKEAILSFVGGYDQIPPMYSAKKVDGVKLYELARKGKEVERKSVHVDIYSIEIVDINLPRVRMRVHCGKGTYIRSLIADIGEYLKCGAAMETLLRTKVGEYSIDSAYKLADIEQLVADGEIENIIKPVDTVFEGCREIIVPQELCKLIYNGNALEEYDFDVIDKEFYVNNKPYEKIRVYDYEKRFVAVYEYIESKKIFKPYKMFL